MRMNAHCYKAMGGLKIWYNDECFEFDWQTATKFNECTNCGHNQNKNNYELFKAYRWESAHTIWWHSLSENITVNLNLVRLRFGSAFSVTQPNNRTIKNEMCANGFYGFCNYSKWFCAIIVKNLVEIMIIYYRSAAAVWSATTTQCTCTPLSKNS